MGAIGRALILIATLGAVAEPPPHLAEIKLFASTVAIAGMARDECPGTTVNDPYLESLRERLHIVQADYRAYVPEAKAVAQALQKGLSEALSHEAWCAAVFRLYGPDGKMIRGLLRRS